MFDPADTDEQECDIKLTRSEQMIQHSELKKRKGESIADFKKRLASQKNRTSNEKFFLKPTNGAPYTNVSQEIRCFLCSHVSATPVSIPPIFS